MYDPYELLISENVRVAIVLFVSLYLYAFTLGYFIKLVISLLYKICGLGHGKE